MLPALPGSLAEFKGTAAVAWARIILRSQSPQDQALGVHDNIFTLCFISFLNAHGLSL